MSTDAALTLEEWAVTCDALARGEQIMLLRDDRLDGRDGGPSSLPRDSFWLHPTTEDQSPSAVADPYRDRIRALDTLARNDRRVRLQYAATAEHAERIAAPDRLMALDGHHTLNRSAVEERLRNAGPEGLLFLIVRIYRRETAVVVDESRTSPAGGGWVRVDATAAARLDRARVEREMAPVMSDRRFLSRKAELLQVSGTLQAV